MTADVRIQPGDRLINIAEVQARTSLSASTIFRRRRQKTFPQPYELKGSKRIAWLQSEIDRWLMEEISEAPS